MTCRRALPRLHAQYPGGVALESLLLSIRLERRWPLWCALAVAVAWAAAVIVDLVVAPPLLSVHAIAGIAQALLPPAALLSLVAALLPTAGRSLALADLEPRLDEARTLAESLGREAQALDAALASSTARIETLAASAHLPQLSEDAAALEKSAARVVAGGESTQKIVAAFAEALPALERTIAAVDTTLRAVSADSAAQFRAVETMMSAVQSRNHGAVTEAESTLSKLAGLLAQIDEASTRNTATLSKRAYALDAAIDGVLERTTAAVDGIHQRVVAELEAMTGGVEGAGKHLGLLGDDGARLFNQRLEMLRRTSDDLQTRIAAHESESDRLRASMEEWLATLESRFVSTGEAGAAVLQSLGSVTSGHVDALEQRLADVRASSSATTDDMAARVGAIETALTALQAPIDSAGTALASLESQTGQFGHTVAEIEALLAEKLSATRESMAALEAESQRLSGAVSALGATVAEGSALVGEAATTLAGEREAVARMAADLTGHFESAIAALADIETASATASQGVAAGLGSEIARIAAAAEAAAADMRDTLARVVDEAVATLESSTSQRAEAAFGVPVRAHLAAIETATERAASAGDHTAGRLAGLMLSLVETINTVEARIDEVDTRFTVRARDSMAAYAMRILRQLEAATVDVAGLLRLSISDADWERHLRGDNSVVAKALAPQLDRDVARQMARLFQQDPAFHGEANRFCAMFEAMIQRLLGDHDGEALAATLLTSDIGKIYAAIADATDRTLPQR